MLFKLLFNANRHIGVILLRMGLISSPKFSPALHNCVRENKVPAVNVSLDPQFQQGLLNPNKSSLSWGDLRSSALWFIKLCVPVVLIKHILWSPGKKSWNDCSIPSINNNADFLKFLNVIHCSVGQCYIYSYLIQCLPTCTAAVLLGCLWKLGTMKKKRSYKMLVYKLLSINVK